MSAVLDYWDRRLLNWATWVVSGGARTAISGAYSARDRGDGAPRPPPPLVGEALDTDDLVAKLAREHLDAVHAWYVWTGPITLKLEQLGVCRATFTNRLRAAKFRLDDLEQARKAAARKLRVALDETITRG